SAFAPLRQNERTSPLNSSPAAKIPPSKWTRLVHFTFPLQKNFVGRKPLSPLNLRRSSSAKFKQSVYKSIDDKWSHSDIVYTCYKVCIAAHSPATRGAAHAALRCWPTTGESHVCQSIFHTKILLRRRSTRAQARQNQSRRAQKVPQ